MLELKNVFAGYGGADVLHDISCAFPDGSCWCVLGPNGCGKTTLLRTMAGLIPHRGQVLLEGEEIGGMKRRRLAGRIAVMSQVNAVYFPYTVYDTVMLGRYQHMRGALFGGPSPEDRAAVERCLEFTGLQKLRRRHLDELSGGQRQRVFLAHALATKACHELVEDGRIGPAVSSTCTYPLTNKPEDVWAARMNNQFKTDYCLDMHMYGEYPGYYMAYLKEQDMVPSMEEGDAELLKSAKMDFIALNYYRTLTAGFFPADAEHPKGLRQEGMNEVDYDMYGYWKIEKNTNLAASEYGAQIDPIGLRIVLNEYWNRYRLPLIITENGLGTADTLTEDGKIHDDYRIDYMRRHVEAIGAAIEDGVEMMGYCPWSVIDLLSSHQGFRKRYGLVYVNRSDMDLKDLARIRKDSFYWYQNVIRTNGKEL